MPKSVGLPFHDQLQKEKMALKEPITNTCLNVLALTIDIRRTVVLDLALDVSGQVDVALDFKSIGEFC